MLYFQNTAVVAIATILSGVVAAPLPDPEPQVTVASPFGTVTFGAVAPAATTPVWYSPAPWYAVPTPTPWYAVPTPTKTAAPIVWGGSVGLPFGPTFSGTVSFGGKTVAEIGAEAEAKGESPTEAIAQAAAENPEEASAALAKAIAEAAAPAAAATVAPEAQS